MKLYKKLVITIGLLGTVNARQHHHADKLKMQIKHQLHHNRLVFHGTSGCEKEDAGLKARAYVEYLIDKVEDPEGIMVKKTRYDQEYMFSPGELAIWATGAGMDGNDFESYVIAHRNDK